jgi:hypothetical protein
MTVRLVCIDVGHNKLTVGKVYTAILGMTTERSHYHIIQGDDNNSCVFSDSIVCNYFCSLDEHRQKQLLKLV